jgi:aminoglycoside phosphotransferase (APT) family kinase protein
VQQHEMEHYERPLLAAEPDTAEVERLLSTTRVSNRLGNRIGTHVQAVPLGARTYRISGSKGTFIVRFPRDRAHLSVLKKEESVQRELRNWVSVLVPDTSVIDDLDGCSAFAIHSMIPGQPLTTECYSGASSAGRGRLVTDLATFFHETHRIPLPVACQWLGVPFERKETVAKLASRQGKPTWFSPDAVASMRPQLEPLIDRRQAATFEDTIRRFEALGTDPDNMVFGHGDMHGYNIAIAEDDLGPRLAGVFDLECTGVLDIHEDFFRLSLVSEELLDDVVDTYERLSGRARPLERDRIAIYYRAFLFYLMVGKSGEGLDHLKRLLQGHVTYYEDVHGGLGEAGG